MKIHYERDKGLGMITLENHPDNKLDSPQFADNRELANFLGQPDLKAAIIKGAGRNFSFGADPALLAQQIKSVRKFAASLNQGKSILRLINEASVPIAAVIKGGCLGAGLEIALACHFRFASNTALLGFPEANLGLMPGFGGTYFSSERTTRQEIIKLMISGRMIDGIEAKRLGIVDYNFKTSLVEEEAKKFLRTLTENRSPQLIRAIMKAINNSSRLPIDEALKTETKLFIEVAKNVSF